MSPFHLGHYSSKLITPSLRERQMCAVISISALVFLIFPFPCVLAIQGKVLFPLPLQVVFSLFRKHGHVPKY